VVNILTRCENCGKNFSIQANRYRKHKHHFCSRKCWVEWLKKHPEVARRKNDNQDRSYYNKLLHLAELRRQLVGDRDVSNL